MKGIIDLIIDTLQSILGMVRRVLEKLLDIFLELNPFEKGVIIACVGGLLAVVLSVGRYYIFDTWFYINNPLAVYMIGLTGIMFVTTLFQHLAVMVLRVLLNAWYLAAMLVIHFSQGIIKAPYELTAGYFVNLVVPVVFIVLSGLSYLLGQRL
jgi:hypothetical protein